jgi:hypothetical protein
MLDVDVIKSDATGLSTHAVRGHVGGSPHEQEG